MRLIMNRIAGGRFEAVLFLCAVYFLDVSTLSADDQRPPNIVVIFADDLGYGDLGCFGHPTIRTPNLDRMASEGVKLTQFYSASSVCTPSRAALLTGRLPIRSGMCSTRRRVLFPNSKGGIPAREITVAEALKTKGYATACVGKWHLGHLKPFLPTNNGFDSYFGIPYSNDMDRRGNVGPRGRKAFLEPKSEYWNVPLMRDEEIIERPADQTTITRRYGEEAVRFIRREKSKPFFLYLAHNLPHVPLFAGQAFLGKSPRGLFGDVIEEIDWTVGRVLDTIREEGIAENTLVFFTSDNGPWLIFNEHGGSAGLLREGKGCTWEGGMREPCIAWWPGKIKPGTVNTELASTMDIFATSLALAGIPLPSDRIVDGVDMSPMLTGQGAGKRTDMFFYRGDQLFAVRKGSFKAHFVTQGAYGGQKRLAHNPPLLYNLDHDPSEKYNIAKAHPEVIADIRKVVEAHQAKMKPGKNQLELR